MIQKHKGVQVRGERMRVYFQYGGRRVFKSVSGQPTPENIAHCARIVEAIEREIAAGTFVYQKYFPDENKHKTFGDYLGAWLETKRLEVSKSSFRAFESRCENWLLPRWGAVLIDQVDYLSIQKWIQGVLMPELTNKTIRDILSMMDQVFKYYRRVTGSTLNPTEGCTVRLSEPAEADPLTKAEIRRVLAADADPMIINMIRFMVYSGLRISEVLAVAWSDVDLNEGTVTVSRARVASEYKVTKTRRSTRKLKLLRPAVEALREQRLLTGGSPLVAVEVMQRDNRTLRPASLGFVFHNPNTRRAFSTADNFRINYWGPLLSSAGVRHRGPNQLRHTYASQLLSSGLVSVDWIAHQLGHTGTQMIYRHYGRWIPEDAANIVGRLDAAFSFE